MASSPGFLFVGNNLALDFVNTELQGAAGRIDLIRSDDELLEWARMAGLGAGAPGGRTSRVQLDERVKPLRAALRSIVEAMIDGLKVSPGALATINVLLTQPTGAPPLVYRRGRFARAPAADLTPQSVLRRITEEAAELLTTADLDLLRRCESSDCILVFYDTSRSHRRRWCSMSVCGNRAKVNRHYRRTRDGRAIDE